MARLPDFGVVEGVPCDQCGCLDGATVHMADASLCDDCFQTTMMDALTPIMGFCPCCRITWARGIPSLCMYPADAEHNHSGDAP